MLIKDLISLPERVQAGDYVLRLAQGVSDDAAATTLREYVITPELLRNFVDALGAIKGALDSRSSKAGYLHGSFGSGKSHFMAVLFLLLRGNLAARSLPELAGLVADHDAWLSRRKILCVPFHMIGARSMEQGILGQYLSFVQAQHPDAPLPGVFLSGPIFDNARELRQAMGDELFFSRLNTSQGDSEWGELGAAWDANSFEHATSAPPGDEAHLRLVGDLVTTLLPAFRTVAIAGDSFLDLDRGLAAISQHASGLGYDALVLFLDELILWLASHAAEPEFIAREGQKLAKLVEAQDARRPAPIVSFIARQRDLRELVGQQTGAQDLAFQDVLNYSEGRFFRITLEDRNLPAIIERRVLTPKSEAARQQIDRAFREATADPTLVNNLLTRESDLAMFRQVYPFSPALVQVLVAVSSMLQRERTAIKVLLQLLVEQRDTLKLGDFVPVGDLFDAVADGANAFSESMRRYFDQAKRLYETRLQPLIEEQRGARFADLVSGQVEPAKAKAMRADDRLVKTLLLAALVPEVEVLRGLTPARLAMLNHGTIQTPIPGAERQLVRDRIGTWAARMGEVRIGGDTDNPTVAIQLGGVDVEGIIERARNEDNGGNRRRKIRDILFEQLGISDSTGLFETHDFVWRGTKRHAEVVYGNIRELSDDQLRARGDVWRVVVDYPFDPDPNRTPQDDLAALRRFRQHNGATRTIAWVPSFLSHSALDDLGRLVVLDHILAGERFQQYAAHLSLLDRQTAKGLLENQQAQLRQRLRTILEGAYGIATMTAGTVVQVVEPEDQFQSLDPACRLQAGIGVNLHDALDHLLRQALDAQYPRHPDFGDADIRPATLKRVWGEVQTALQSENWRRIVDQRDRKLVRQIVYPLELCDVGENVIVVKRTWQQHFDRYHAQEGGALKVQNLRKWLDLPEPRGLLPEVQNLVILTYAEMTNRRFTLHGGPATASIDSIDDRCELVEEPLPPPTDWDGARQRAARIFGLDLPPLRNATTVGEGSEQIVAEAKKCRAGVRDLARVLPDVQRRFGVDPATSPRSRTVAGLFPLLETLERAQHRDVVGVLGQATIATSPEAFGACAKAAAETAAALHDVNWQPIEALSNMASSGQTAAGDLLKDLRQALELDELAIALAPKLLEIERNAVALLIPPPQPRSPQPPPPNVPEPPRPGAEHWRTIVSKSLKDASPADAKQEFEQALSQTRKRSDVRVTVSWTIEEKVDE